MKLVAYTCNDCHKPFEVPFGTFFPTCRNCDSILTSRGIDNPYELPEWSHPDSYGGYSPDADYVIISRNRDSSILENSNYDEALKALEMVESTYDAQGICPDGDDDRAYVHDFRAGHWACGWVEYIIVRRDAPLAIQKEAYEILGALEDYPVLNDADFSEREIEQAYNDFDRVYDLREKIEMCARYGESIFAARAETYDDFRERAPQAADYILEHVHSC